MTYDELTNALEAQRLMDLAAVVRSCDVYSAFPSWWLEQVAQKQTAIAAELRAA